MVKTIRLQVTNPVAKPITKKMESGPPPPKVKEVTPKPNRKQALPLKSDPKVPLAKRQRREAMMETMMRMPVRKL